MIVYKQWKKTDRLGLRTYQYEGWFLFGFMPLYVRRLGAYT
jgi:hypothetical protein